MSEELSNLRKEILDKLENIERIMKKSDADNISILTDINFALSKLDEAVSKLRERIG